MLAFGAPKEAQERRHENFKWPSAMGRTTPPYFILSLVTALFCPLNFALGVENPVVPAAQLRTFQHGTLVKKIAPDKLVLALSPDEATHTHIGVDLAAPRKSIIYSFADGKVKDVINTKAGDYSFLGFMVLIEHPAALLGKTFYTIYLHMDEPPSVRKGQEVRGGKTEIGKVGNSGNADGFHTHFEVRYFSKRLFSKWGNIYGPGDQRISLDFKENWEDPVILFTRYPQGLSLPRINSGKFRLPAKWAAQLGPALLALGPVLFIVSGLLLIFQLKRAAARLFVLGVVSTVLGALGPDLAPLLAFLQALPLWLVVLIGALLGLVLLRAFVSIFIGRSAADTMAGTLAAGLFKSFFLAVVMPFKLLRKLFGGQ